jgi:transcriptional regulator with XRE-family HTH domain
MSKDLQAKKQKTKISGQFGVRLRAIRVKKGHASLERFAYEAKVSRVLYSNWELGKGNITLNSLAKVLAALGMTFKEFFSEGFE